MTANGENMKDKILRCPNKLTSRSSNNIKYNILPMEMDIRDNSRIREEVVLIKIQDRYELYEREYKYN